MSLVEWFKHLPSDLLTGFAKAAIVMFLLGGCSPAPETEGDEGDLAAEEDNPDSYSQGLLEDGWRKGKLEISFELAQAASITKSTSSGGQSTSPGVAMTGYVPDLRVLVPDSGNTEARRSAIYERLCSYAA